MKDYFPTIEDTSVPLSPEQFRIIEKTYINEGEGVTIQTRFNYAWAYVRESSTTAVRKGVIMLTELYKDAPSRRREILYYLAIGCFKLGEYSDARKYTDVLIANDSSNAQAVALREKIEKQLNREGLVGIAIVGGVIALGTAVVAGMLRRRK